MTRGARIPSYKQGFARNAAQSERPNAWKGLVGAWLPSLGPTGLTLRDWGRGQNNHGVLTNGPTWVAASRGGWTLDFAGANQHVNCGAGNALDITGPMTIECWFYVAAAGEYDVLGKWDGSDLGYLLLMNSGGALRFFTGGTASANRSTANFIAGDWHQAVGLYDGTDNRIVLDGQPGTDAATPLAPASTAGNLLFGIRYDDTRDFVGQIGPVLIYNRPRTLSEIAHDFADPWAMWRLRQQVFLAAVAAPAGAIMNQIQKANLGADLYNGALSV